MSDDLRSQLNRVERKVNFIGRLLITLSSIGAAYAVALVADSWFGQGWIAGLVVGIGVFGTGYLLRSEFD